MYDTIILGAGSAGCVLANRLSADPGRRVLLLEAGRAAPRNADIPANWPLMFNTEADWNYHTVPQEHCKGRRMYWPRGRMLGGSGSLNAMIYMRGLPSDYDGWESRGCPGWGWDRVLAAFRRSERNIRLGNSPYHGASGELVVSDVAHVDPVETAWLEAAQAAGLARNEDFNGARQDGVGLFQATIRDGERFGPSKAFLAPVLGRPNLTVRTGVTVLRIGLEGTQARSVDVLVEGVAETIHASSEIVVAAGAIGSPHVLLNSGIGPAHELSAVGIRPRVDLPGVGRDLQDHVNCSVTFSTKAKHGIAHATDAEARAHLEEWSRSRSGPLTSNWSACGGFVNVRSEVDPDLQIYCIVTGNRDHTRYLSSEPGITLYSVLQRPESRGSLKLRSADPLEHPAIDPNYFSDPEGRDLQLLIEGIRLNRDIVSRSPVREFVGEEISTARGAADDASLAEFVRGHCTTLYHPTSTCRMGSDPLAVVDPSLRVRGVEGLYVVDASVFPAMVSGNTNAPVIMVAEMAAEMIAGGRNEPRSRDSTLIAHADGATT